MSSEKKRAEDESVLLMPAPWTEPEPLSDIVGGEINLLPRSAWSDPGNPLKVEFLPWAPSNPSPTGAESIEIFLGTASIGFKEWDAPIAPNDHFVPISADKLTDGEHTLTYTMTNWLGTTQGSLPFTVTVDKQEPRLHAPSGLVFPAEVLRPNKLTAQYLDLNTDKVKADLPAYVTPRPGDRITWYWGATPGNLDVGGVIELDNTDFSAPIVITVEGDLIRDRNDGFRYVWYQVHDRAGNPSARSDFVELDVAATPIPRSLPWPDVERAAGTGEQQTLDPLQADTGAVVQVPQDAVIYPQEGVFVQWAEPGTPGAVRVEQAIIPGQRRYAIPMKSVAAYIDKTLWVSYGVTDSDNREWPSLRRKLRVSRLSNLPTVQCNGLTGGSLSLKTVPAEGAILRLAKWPLITSDQWIMITMTGVGSTGHDAVETVITKRVLSAQEVIGGVGMQNDVRVKKTFLNTLRRNAPLTGKVYVSFDGGATWPPVSSPNFPLLQLTLID